MSHVVAEALAGPLARDFCNGCKTPLRCKLDGRCANPMSPEEAGAFSAERTVAKSRGEAAPPAPKSIAEELEELNRKNAERMCRVGSPRGPEGTVERIYQKRKCMPGVFGARVIMFESGSVRNVGWDDVYVS